MKKFVHEIPKPLPVKKRKKCYSIYTKSRVMDVYYGGKIVWLTDHELTIAKLKYPEKQFRHMAGKENEQRYRVYRSATID